MKNLKRTLDALKILTPHTTLPATPLTAEEYQKSVAKFTHNEPSPDVEENFYHQLVMENSDGVTFNVDTDTLKSEDQEKTAPETEEMWTYETQTASQGELTEGVLIDVGEDAIESFTTNTPPNEKVEQHTITETGNAAETSPHESENIKGEGMEKDTPSGTDTPLEIKQHPSYASVEFVAPTNIGKEDSEGVEEGGEIPFESLNSEINLEEFNPERYLKPVTRTKAAQTETEQEDGQTALQTEQEQLFGKSSSGGTLRKVASPSEQRNNENDTTSIFDEKGTKENATEKVPTISPREILKELNETEW